MQRKDTGKYLNKKAGRYFRVAAEKRQSAFDYPEAKKQIVIVSRNYKLLSALSELAE